MLKMFSTQLSGLFNRIQEHEDFAIEDGARLLAQAAVGDGKIYIYAKEEMKAVAFEAAESREPVKNAAIWPDGQSLDTVSDVDRFLIVARDSADKDAIAFAHGLKERETPFVAISTVNDEGKGLDGLADVHINLRLTKGLLPDETGNRFGFPSSMAALFVYYGIKFTLDEILSEYE